MRILSILLILFVFKNTFGQVLHSKHKFVIEDTLRGSITPERIWWDLQHYHLEVTVNPSEKAISGKNTIRYKVLTASDVLQVDLQEPMVVLEIRQDGKTLTYNKKGKNAYFITLQKQQNIGNIEEIEIFYAGKPRAAKRAPWDGGFSWNKDAAGNFFVATSCQGLGASVWWPCKDHMYDEPDSMAISITVPKDYTDVSNGVLKSTEDHQDGFKTFNWVVSNPINNYGVNVNIGKYEHFSEIYEGENGKLAMDYYVLPENLEKAKEQFKQAPQMMKAFEHWFGPYPFYQDGFKLVEVPYLGMEHQSSVTYGNKFKNGYLGRDLSKSGWGLKWDFIIVHESGHEWFANNITYKDVADMWIHEGFTAYSETLFTEYYYGKEAANAYVTGTRANILNDQPIIGTYGLNIEGSADMYYKGANMIHGIRQYVSDEKFREILRGMNKTFYHQTVDSKQIEDYLSQNIGRDLSKVFDQYLRDNRVPILEYRLRKKKVNFRYRNCIEGFEMPIIVNCDGNKIMIEPSTIWKSKKLKSGATFIPDANFLVKVEELKEKPIKKDPTE